MTIHCFMENAFSKGTVMKKGDAMCPVCKAGFRRLELSSVKAAEANIAVPPATKFWRPSTATSWLYIASPSSHCARMKGRVGIHIQKLAFSTRRAAREFGFLIVSQGRDRPPL